MKQLFILILLVTLASCSVEQRIKEHSYTDEWYYEGGQRYQVYKTKLGNRYIIIINKKLNLQRKYI
jgi:hypothetical protein